MASPCQVDGHLWVAIFFENGRLAYWRCDGCGESDRALELGEKRLAGSNWNTPIPVTARGPRPPISSRTWATADGHLLVEGEPNAVDYLGAQIPGLTEAFEYELRDGSGTVIQRFHAVQERTSRWGTGVELTRFAVEGDALVRIVSYGHEESTFDIPIAGKARRRDVLTGLLAGTV